MCENYVQFLKPFTLLKQLESSPFHYDTHLALIKTLREQGDLDNARQAREMMSKLFPLTTGSWGVVQ